MGPLDGAGPGAGPEPGPGSKSRPFRFGTLAPPEDPGLPPGAAVGDRYRILGLLGEGGMGRVYEAEAVVPAGGSARGPEGGGSRVALKILRRERGQSEQLARFRQEAKAASRVGHPAIVQVLEFAELPDGTVYLAMERLHGQSLEDWLEAPGRLRDGLGWLAQIARGLHAAHAAGVVHRDVKPANLFLAVDPRDPQGRVRATILDFGIAKVVTGDVTRIETQAGTLLGTPYYLAPERALGRSLDARADLYSLGVILYEMLTGLVPFEDESFMGILAQHIQAQPLDPRQAAPDRVLPAGVCQLTMRLLAKDPADRPPDGAALADELEALLQREAAEIDAVATGPRRETAAAGDATVQLQDLAERPTAAPADRRGARPTPATHALGQAVETSGTGWAAAPSGSATQRAGSGSAAAGSVRAAERPAGSPRWALWVAGAVGMVLLGSAASWAALQHGGAAEVDAPEIEADAGAPEPEAELDEAEPERPTEIAAEPEPAAEPGSARSAEAGPDPVPTPASAVEGEPAQGEPAGAAGSEGPPPTPLPTSGDRTSTERPKASRPRRSKPKPPAPPAFKDDVYED